MLMTLVTILHVFACLFLVLVVLLQTGKGAEMGAVFGGGGSQTIFGASGAGNGDRLLHHLPDARVELARADARDGVRRASSGAAASRGRARRSGRCRPGSERRARRAASSAVRRCSDDLRRGAVGDRRRSASGIDGRSRAERSWIVTSNRDRAIESVPRSTPCEDGGIGRRASLRG
jgi:hypothetical protein